MHLLAIVVAGLIALSDPTSGGSFSEQIDRKCSELEAKRRQFEKVWVGMTEEQVREIMGEPDETYIQGKDRLSSPTRQPVSFLWGTEYQWAYGAPRFGGLATIGIVSFGTDRRVVYVKSPIQDQFMRPGVDKVPLSDEAIPTPAGVRCQLSHAPSRSEKRNGCGEELPAYRHHWVRATLINEGKEPFSCGWNAFGFLFVIEILDDNKIPVSRFDRAPLQSGLPPAPCSLPAGGQESTNLFAWSRAGELGGPSPGTYYVRVLFTGEDGKLYPSNMLKLVVPGDETSSVPPKP